MGSQTHSQKKNMDHTTVSEFQTTTHTLQKKNTDQLTDLESQTTTHTLQKKNTDQLTDSESQTNTTKKDTQRVTTTQLDAFQGEEDTDVFQEEDQDASEDADQDVTEEDHTPRDAVSTTSSVKNKVTFEKARIPW